ncbi:hypothetical protein BXP70_02230 [Hymenobacter crusticola]|uniref:Uncharacterized protein n=1 Tax=Hymenobacter crusticola TaxID=1770526 RepID=A0A243WJN7_9BACT|nr:hypothetical protein BXP70_02230 [Hymenobacter crusticola]
MITLLLILVTSYWTYCSLFSVFVLVALYSEKKKMDRSVEAALYQEIWHSRASEVPAEESNFCLERVYVQK